MTEKFVCENCTIIGMPMVLVATVEDGRCDKAFTTCDNIRCDYYTEETK